MQVCDEATPPHTLFSSCSKAASASSRAACSSSFSTSRRLRAFSTSWMLRPPSPIWSSRSLTSSGIRRGLSWMEFFNNIHIAYKLRLTSGDKKFSEGDDVSGYLFRVICHLSLDYSSLTEQFRSNEGIQIQIFILSLNWNLPYRLCKLWLGRDPILDRVSIHFTLVCRERNVLMNN